METCTFKVNIRENRISGGATCRHYAQSIHVSLDFIQKFACDVTDVYS